MEIEDLGRPITFSCPECGGALRVKEKTACRSLVAMSGIAARDGAAGGPVGWGRKGHYVALRMLNEQAEFARPNDLRTRATPRSTTPLLLGALAGRGRGTGGNLAAIPRKAAAGHAPRGGGSRKLKHQPDPRHAGPGLLANNSDPYLLCEGRLDMSDSIAMA